MITRKEVPPGMKDIAYNAYWLDKSNADLIDVVVAVINAWPGVKFDEYLSVRDNAEGYDVFRTGVKLPFVTKKD